MENVHRIGHEGDLVTVDRTEDHIFNVYWTDGRVGPVQVFTVDTKSRRIILFPHKWSKGDLVPQYDRIRKIVLPIHEEFDPYEPESFAEHSPRTGDLVCELFPRGFTRTFGSGLGPLKSARRLLHGIEKQQGSVDTVLFVGTRASRAVGAVFALSSSTYKDYAARLERYDGRVSNARRRVEEFATEEILSQIYGLPIPRLKFGQNPMVRLLTADVGESADLDERATADLINLVQKSSKVILASDKLDLTALRNDLDLVSLATLIQRMERQLHRGKGGAEKDWQKFFASNTFVLKQLFAAPLEFKSEELFVRPSDTSGRGERKADFAFANPLTKTLFIVEIKTPATELVEPNPYRGKGEAEVYPPNRNLTGAVAQLQSQIESARRDLPSMGGFLELNVAAEHVQGCLVVGSVEHLDDAQVGSFERYRRGLANIEVVTFDELLERIRTLRDFLESPPQLDPDNALF